MNFLIDKETTGLTTSLLWSDKQQKVVKPSQMGEQEELLTFSTRVLEDLSKLYLFEAPKFPSKKYQQIYNPLLLSKENIPWALCMPRETFVREVNLFAQQVHEVVKNLDLSYYTDYFIPGQTVFDSLVPAKINKETFNSLVETHKDNTVLASFAPKGSTTFTNPCTYTRTDTVTGRLKVVKGPQILHLKREFRNSLFESRFGSEGKIYEFDYKSLEPRVLLASNGMTDIPEDVYIHTLKELFQGHDYLDRSIVKQLLLTSLYGGSITGSGGLIPPNPNGQSADYVRPLPERVQRSLSECVGVIEDYFGIEDLRARLVAEKEENKFITSFYGRRIDTQSARNGILVNYFTQSTAMTVVEQGLTKVVNALAKRRFLNRFVFPLFLVTDALYMDIHNSVEEETLSLVSSEGSTQIPMLEETKFYLEAKPYKTINH